MSLVLVILGVFLQTIGGGECPLPPIGAANIVVSNINETGSVPIENSPYSYEAWTDAYPPAGAIPEGKVPADFNMTIYGVDADGKPTAAFKAEWRKSSDFLARVGIKLDEGKNYTDYGPITAEYAYNRKPYTCVPIDGQPNKCVDDGAAGDYSYIGVYGWTRNPLVEYYVVDDWFGNPYNQVDGDSVNVGEGTICYDYVSADPPKTCYVGTFTVDGSEYKVYNHHRDNAFTIDGEGAFDQYFSLRQTPRKSGVISVSEHFKEWERLNMTLGELYEVKLLAEAGGGIGWIDYCHAAVKIDSTGYLPCDCPPPTEPNDDDDGSYLTRVSASLLLLIVFWLFIEL